MGYERPVTRPGAFLRRSARRKSAIPAENGAEAWTDPGSRAGRALAAHAVTDVPRSHQPVGPRGWRRLDPRGHGYADLADCRGLGRHAYRPDGRPAREAR